MSRQFQLNCTLMIIADDENLWFSANEAIKPIEKEMIEMVERNQRFVDFGVSTIINFSNLSLLVKNMPLNDMERYGRIKDLLPMLMTAVNSKINSIKVEQALGSQSEELMQSFGQIRSYLYYLAKTLIVNQNESTELLQSMVTELNTDFLRLGLEDDQEAYVLNRIDSAIEEAKNQLDASDTMYHVFSRILASLKLITSKQQQLLDTFTEMNTPTVNLEVEDDGSIELF